MLSSSQLNRVTEPLCAVVIVIDVDIPMNQSAPIQHLIGGCDGVGWPIEILSAPTLRDLKILGAEAVSDQYPFLRKSDSLHIEKSEVAKQ